MAGIPKAARSQTHSTRRYSAFDTALSRSRLSSCRALGGRPCKGRIETPYTHPRITHRLIATWYQKRYQVVFVRPYVPLGPAVLGRVRAEIAVRHLRSEQSLYGFVELGFSFGLCA